MSTLDPRAAATANAAVTVVFPTPPLPATMTTWEVEQNCATSIPACYERPMRSPVFDSAAVAAWPLWCARARACGPALAPQPPMRPRRFRPINGIVVVQVNGLLDPPNAALITKSLRDAERARASLVAFQLSASGAVDVNVDSLVRAIARSPVPVAVWVGPSGGRARGASALLALAASYVAVAPGAHIGPDRSRRLRTSALGPRGRATASVGAPARARDTRGPRPPPVGQDGPRRQADRRYRADGRSVHRRP